MVDEPSLSTVTEVTVAASRGMLGAVARSVSGVLDQVTLPQLRALVILSTHGPQRTGDLAARLGVHQSTFSRSADRLVRGGWVERVDNPRSRREVLLALTPTGRDLVTTVNRRRRKELQTILRAIPADRRALVAEAMSLFAEAAGEPALQDLLTLAL